MKSWFSRAGAALLFLSLLSIPAAAQVSDIYIVPAIADTPGAGSTYWQTSFHLMNPQPHSLIVTLVFLPTGGSVGDLIDLEIPANTTVSSENILADFEAPTAVTGGLIVFVDSEMNPSVADDVLARSVILQTRTFNVTSTGTLGQGIDGAMTGLLDIEFDGLTAIASGVRNTAPADLPGFRTNIGGVNLGDSSVTLNVTVWRPDGSEAGTFPLFLPPQAHLQDLLPVLIDHASVEFFVEDLSPSDTDFVFPYASVVDNRTGDATYLDPKLLATPNGVFLFKSGAVRTSPDRITARAVRPIANELRSLGRARFVPHRADPGVR